jgi:hypothetical protein
MSAIEAVHEQKLVVETTPLSRAIARGYRARAHALRAKWQLRSGRRSQSCHSATMMRGAMTNVAALRMALSDGERACRLSGSGSSEPFGHFLNGRSWIEPHPQPRFTLPPTGSARRILVKRLGQGPPAPAPPVRGVISNASAVVASVHRLTCLARTRFWSVEPLISAEPPFSILVG